MGNTWVTCGASRGHANLKTAEGVEVFKQLATVLTEDGLLAIWIKATNQFPMLAKMNRLGRRYLLLREFRHSRYEFSSSERVLGIKLRIDGYKQRHAERVVDRQDGVVHMKVEDCDLYAVEGAFKTMELSHLYNETFAPPRQNPHAYETEDVKIEEGDYVVDAGACEGFFVRYALGRGARAVFAFEPLRQLSRGLDSTFRNEIDTNKVKVFGKGLSDRETVARFDMGGYYICTARMNPRGGQECYVTSLDNMVQAGSIPRVDFIKMDIEGAEVLAVRGAKETIRMYRPKLSIAVYHDYENANAIKGLILSYRGDYKVSFGGCYVWERPYRPFMLYAW